MDHHDIICDSVRGGTQFNCQLMVENCSRVIIVVPFLLIPLILIGTGKFPSLIRAAVTIAFET